MALDLDRLQNESFVAGVEWHKTLESTNDLAMQRAAQESLETPFLILADEQTTGRGRGNNRWWSGTGALTFSLVIDPQTPAGNGNSPQRAGGFIPPVYWPRVALVAGVSLCEALEILAPQLDYGLKWPNDVLIAGKKVAGILVEIPPARPPIPRRLVLGMGVNVNNSLAESPPEIQSVGTALCDATGLEFDRTQVLLAWLDRFSANLSALAADSPALPAGWQSRCVLTGQTIELQAGDRAVRGVCRGIDVDGALLVDTPTGPERLYGGVLVRVLA
ncbi:MAG: biotin--[acetyl-CoA-carboxylase] ligase [Planctomycetaceae bacterium]|nr:biotin--[acetyl-CoA-carboxylase] ligase [Planctomycetaceae bacterium]